MNRIKISIFIISLGISVAQANDFDLNTIIGDPNTHARGEVIPSGEEGAYFQSGAAAGADAISPSTYSTQQSLQANFKAGLDYSCGKLSFYNNINAEVERLKYRLEQIVSNAQGMVVTMASAAVTSYVEYMLMKVNPPLMQLARKKIDEYMDVFDLKVKQCRDFERDIANGRNPLSELIHISVGEEWKKTIGLVNTGEISLDEASDTIIDRAQKNGLKMADGKSYGGEGQKPINIVKSILSEGLNALTGKTIAGRAKKKPKPTPTPKPTPMSEHPILDVFDDEEKLYKFVESIYGAKESYIDKEAKTSGGVRTKSIPGQGYEKHYVKLRNGLIQSLTKLVNNDITRTQFLNDFPQVLIPPIEIENIRYMSPYQKQMTIEATAQKHAIQLTKRALIFAKQALKSGIYAPDIDETGLKKVMQEEYKNLYYRILDDIAEISNRAYTY